MVVTNSLTIVSSSQLIPGKHGNPPLPTSGVKSPVLGAVQPTICTVLSRSRPSGKSMRNRASGAAPKLSKRSKAVGGGEGWRGRDVAMTMMMKMMKQRTMTTSGTRLRVAGGRCGWRKGRGGPLPVIWPPPLLPLPPLRQLSSLASLALLQHPCNNASKRKESDWLLSHYCNTLANIICKFCE